MRRVNHSHTNMSILYKSLQALWYMNIPEFFFHRKTQSFEQYYINSA